MSVKQFQLDAVVSPPQNTSSSPPSPRPPESSPTQSSVSKATMPVVLVGNNVIQPSSKRIRKWNLNIYRDSGLFTAAVRVN